MESPPPPSTEMLLYRLKMLEDHQREQDEHIEALEKERNAALKWGIMTLGGAVMALFALIGTFVKDHIK